MVFQIPETIEKKLSVKLKIAMVIGSVVVLVGATFAGYYLGQKKNAVPPQVVQNNDNAVPPTDTVGEIVPDPVTLPDSGLDAVVVNFVTTSLPKEIEQRIVWLTEPKKVANTKINWYKNDLTPLANLNYYEVGNFTYEGEKGQVMLVEIPPQDMGVPWYFYIVDFKKELVVLSKYIGYIGRIGDPKFFAQDLDLYLADMNPDVKKSLRFDNTFNIPLLNFPKTLQGSGARQTLSLYGVYALEVEKGFNSYAPDKNNLSAIFTDKQFGAVYIDHKEGAFYMYGAGGSLGVYLLKVDFFDEFGLPQIVWQDGSINTYAYTYTDRNGCGSDNFISVVTSTDVTLVNDLQVIGKTNKGDSVYELKNKQHRLLNYMYENTYQGESYDGTKWIKVSYEKFLAQKPLIFWVDPFGRLIKLENGRFGSQAECGKPVIYLYPEKTSVVDVKVEPQGGMTVSDPFYDGGWQVKAEPNGQLTETKSGKQYPYLFWEGRGGLYQTPERGFVMKKENIAKDLPEKLAQLGLNANETKDFMEFWYPRMQAKPYYFVTFLGTQQMNQLAPLTINPRPDTVVRILMDFTPLDKPVDVLPLSLGRTPERKGFTVIEWGGVIR